MVAAAAAAAEPAAAAVKPVADAVESTAAAVEPVTPPVELVGAVSGNVTELWPGKMRAVQAGIHKLHDAIQILNVHFYPVSAPELLANVNTPAQWETFQHATH